MQGHSVRPPPSPNSADAAAACSLSASLRMSASDMASSVWLMSLRALATSGRTGRSGTGMLTCACLGQSLVYGLCGCRGVACSWLSGCPSPVEGLASPRWRYDGPRLERTPVHPYLGTHRIHSRDAGLGIPSLASAMHRHIHAGWWYPCVYRLHASSVLGCGSRHGGVWGRQRALDLAIETAQGKLPVQHFSCR
jgi:hypothetical protein